MWRDSPYLGGLDKRSASSKPAWETQRVRVPKRGMKQNLGRAQNRKSWGCGNVPPAVGS